MTSLHAPHMCRRIVVTSVCGALLIIVAACGGCYISGTPEVVSLDRRFLFPIPIDPDRLPKLESDLDAAKSAYDANPTDESTIIWYGRRLAYLGRYHEAIDIYTRGLRVHPDSYRLLRHRGHRYITTRHLDRAEADLWSAAGLMEGKPDAIEPDGAPNAANVPLSTDKSNIFYHLGLVLYLQGKYEQSDRIFSMRQGVDGYNDDMLVSTTHWRYHCLRRLGRDTEAAAVLGPIIPDLHVIENDTYFKLCLYYKGLASVSELLPPDHSAKLNPGAAYGVAAKNLADGDTAFGQALLRRVITETDWISFGHIAAEADLARGTSVPGP